MFRDLCVVTDADTTLFIVACVLVGVALGVMLALRTRRWIGRHGPKIGCGAMPLAAVVAGYFALFLFPDPRKAGAECGGTPDVIFYPGFAFCVVPVAMIISFTISCIVQAKSENR